MRRRLHRRRRIRRSSHRNVKISMGISTDMTREAAVAEGVLIVKKEVGWTSHDVVAKVRNLLGGAKVGHAGTLDPAATGVLPVLIGQATRVAEYLVNWDKEYRAVLRLGETTDTQDATGKILAKVDASQVGEEAIRKVVAGFRGVQQQLPPMYSAVKIGGKPLYKSARAGQTVERKERTVTIHQLEILAIDGSDVTMNIVCSKGTYIRTLCADIGQALAVGGHLHSLERRRVGPLLIDQALTVEQVAAQMAIGTLRQHLIGMDQVLEQLPALVVTDEQAQRVLHGGAVSPSGMAQLPFSSETVSVRLKDQGGRLLAIGTCDQRRSELVTIHKVFSGDQSLN
jgi:tRNA pseudouridine55 synthase